MRSDNIILGKESNIPITSGERIYELGTLGISLMAGTFSEAIKQQIGYKAPIDSNLTGIQRYAINSNNANKLTESLCKMRGAALKLGQILSTLEEKTFPKILKDALQRARDQANFMPEEQLFETISSQLGVDWKENFEYFQAKPIAAASIGQVHYARLKNGDHVAIKVQYPGIAHSIEADLKNFLRLVGATNIFPRGLFIEDLIECVREELIDECDYLKEAEKQIFYKQKLESYKEYYIPSIYQKLTTKRILTMEFMEGIPIDNFSVDIGNNQNKEYNENIQDNSTESTFNQEDRNWIGNQLLKLCFIELFSLGFVQTDPNPANFFYNKEKNQLILLDLGAGRTYDDQFLDSYKQIIIGASNKNNELIMDYSIKMGFLTGEENRKMLKAHLNCILALGEAFVGDIYNYGTQKSTQKIYELMPLLLENRLVPPPNGIFQLHRKLSGAFLQCCRLKAIIPTRRLFYDVIGNNYHTI